MFTLPNTTNNQHIKLPPGSAHFHITSPGGQSIPGLQLAAARGARRHRDAPAPAGPRAPACARRPSRRQVAGGSRLCARCLCTPLRAMPPHHYIPRSSRLPLENSCPVVTVNVKCPPLDDFQPRSDRWVGPRSAGCCFACARRRPPMCAVVASKLAVRERR